MNTDKIYNIALHAVAQIYGISEDAVRTGRNPNAMYARHMMYYVLHEEYGFPTDLSVTLSARVRPRLVMASIK